VEGRKRASRREEGRPKKKSFFNRRKGRNPKEKAEKKGRAEGTSGGNPCYLSTIERRVPVGRGKKRQKKGPKKEKDQFRKQK